MRSNMDLARENIANVIDKHYSPLTGESHTYLQQALDDLIRAFGNCTICWGKGYSTQMHGVTASKDFIGDPVYVEPAKIHIGFCTCDRGKQLESIWKSKT